MKYKVWKKKFRDANNQVQEKYFACKATNATVSTKKMAEDIAQRSTISIGDTYGTISEIVISLKKYLPLGDNVNVKGIGTFGISITSNMIDSPDDIAELIVRGKRITFRPDPELVEMLENLHFSYAGEKTVKSGTNPEEKKEQE